MVSFSYNDETHLGQLHQTDYLLTAVTFEVFKIFCLVNGINMKRKEIFFYWEFSIVAIHQFHNIYFVSHFLDLFILKLE